MPLPCSENMDDFPWILGIKSNLPLHAYGGPHSLATPTSLASSPSTLFTSSSNGDRLSDCQEQYVPSNIQAFTFPYRLSTPPLSPWCLPQLLIPNPTHPSGLSLKLSQGGLLWFPRLGLACLWYTPEVCHPCSLLMIQSKRKRREMEMKENNERFLV